MKLACALFLLALAPPIEAELLWEFPTGNHNPQALAIDESNPNYLYAAVKEGGLKVLHVGGKKPRETAHIKKSDLAGLDAMNLWQQGDLLLIALGAFFDARGSHAGLAILDIRNPAQPKVISTWKSKEKLRGSAIIITDKQRKHAYLGVMGHGVMSFDISDPKNPKHLTTFQPDIHFPRNNPGKIQHPNARGMRLDGDHLYVCYDAGGIRVLDVSNPAKPREIGRYINAKMAKKPSAYNNIHLDGDLAYAAIDYAGFEVLDIRDPKRIRQLAWWNPWNAESNKNLWLNSPGHINQIVFDHRKKLVHLAAGDSELVTIDVTDPRKPKLHSSHGEPKNEQGVWGLCANKNADTIYLAYIKTLNIPFHGSWAGIRAVR